MRSLKVAILLAYLLTQEADSFRVKYQLGGCTPTEKWRRQSKSDAGVCTTIAVEEDEVELLSCALPLAGREFQNTRRVSRREDMKMTRENQRRNKSITLYLDNKFELLFENPEWLQSGYNGRIKCFNVITISYKETPEAKCEENLSPRRMFVGLQQKDGLPTMFEVIDSAPIGLAIVDDSYFQCEEGKPSNCRIRAKIHWKRNNKAYEDLSFTGKLIDASIENKLIDNHSQSLEISPFKIEAIQISKINNVSRNIIVYNTENRWQAVFSVMPHFKNINVLNISNSPIQYFGTAVLMGMYQLRELSASSCKIRLVDKGVFKDNTFLTHIDLSRNELNTLQSDLFKDLKLLTYLDISHNKFTHGQHFEFYIHREWPDCGMKLLDMSSNALERAANVIGFGIKVKHVNLANNLLKDLSAMTTGGSIKELNLSGNRIASLSQSSLEMLDMVEYVNLTNNLFDCGSCLLLGFQNWLNSTGRKILSSPPEDLQCSFPSHLRDKKKKVLEAQYDKASCMDQFHAKPEITLFSTSNIQQETQKRSIILLLVTFIFTPMAVIVSVYYKEVFQLVRSILKYAKERGKKEYNYDASISYSSSDEHWVLHELQPALEDGEQKYKLFLNDRGLVLGKVMKKYVMEAMKRCRKSIIILSKDFVKNEWEQWKRVESRILNKNQEKVILIARDKLNRDEVLQNVNTVISEMMYLEWPKKSFSCMPKTINAMGSGDLGKDLGHDKSDISDECSLEMFWKSLYKALGISIYIEASLEKNVQYKQDSNKSEVGSVENDILKETEKTENTVP